MICYEFDLNRIVKIKLLGKETLVPPRMHLTRYVPEYIMYAVTEGELCLEDQGKEITLHAGDIYIFKKHTYQRPLKSTFCKYYYVHFETDLFSEYEMSKDAFYEAVRKKRTDFFKTNRFDTECYSFMKVLLMKENHFEDGGFFDYFTKALENSLLTSGSPDIKERLKTSTVFAELLMRLEEISIDRLEKSRGVKSVKVYRTVQKLVDYIEKNYNSDISSHDIENEIFLNFDYANRIFKKIMGCSIIKYRNMLRINYAKTLIMMSDMTTSEIANEVGFCDACYFIRVFKKFEGITPGQYRERMLQGQYLCGKDE